MRNPNRWKERQKARSDLGRKRAKARWSRPQEREVDADTVRWRALRDAKGKIEREGLTYFGSGATTTWKICRSVAGTSRQLDIIADGRLIKTAGKRRVDKILKRRP